jgi:hypothetical protein
MTALHWSKWNLFWDTVVAENIIIQKRLSTQKGKMQKAKFSHVESQLFSVSESVLPNVSAAAESLRLMICVTSLLLVLNACVSCLSITTNPHYSIINNLFLETIIGRARDSSIKFDLFKKYRKHSIDILTCTYREVLSKIILRTYASV